MFDVRCECFDNEGRPPTQRLRNVGVRSYGGRMGSDRVSECRHSALGFPRARAVAGELHLIRGRVESLLADVAELVAADEHFDELLRVEEAVRLARRALVAAGGALPPLPPLVPRASEFRVGALRVDPVARRQWYGAGEFALTPLHHQLLVALAADPHRVFTKGELVSAVWRDAGARVNAVNTSVSRLRRALVAAGAASDEWLLSVHGVGWALTRPD